MTWTLQNAGPLRGKTVLVTGSNTGIGFAAAKLLADSGVSVVMACRNPQKGRQAMAAIQASTPDAQLRLVELDLAELASVRRAADEVLALDAPIDALINNAGLMMPPLQRTADGFEMQFGTNVLGHFALTGLLLPALQRASHARVVWMSSVAHWDGRIDFDNLNAEHGYGKWRAYAQSKLADLMLAYEMQRRLQRRQISNVLSLGAHPGGTNTDLSRNNPLLVAINTLIAPFTQKPEQGAMPALRAALDPDAQGGEYYGPGGFTTMTGPAVKQRSAARAHDEAVAARLWESCERLSGVRFLD